MALLKQYNQGTNQNNASKFMSTIVSKIKSDTGEDVVNNVIFTPVRLESALDFEVSSGSSSGGSGITVIEEGLKADQNFMIDTSYYFHGRIRRISKTQTIDVKLVNYDDYGQQDSSEQYIKTLVIQPGETYFEKVINDDGTIDENTTKQFSSWVDVEFIFTPLTGDFNVLVFELKRNADDLSSVIVEVVNENGEVQSSTTKSGMRYVVMIYEELSKIENFFGTGGLNIESAIKIGVQSRPGLMMCINNEEIRIGRTGIYELKNEEISINFFSVISHLNTTPILGNIDEISIAQQRLDIRYKNLENIDNNDVVQERLNNVNTIISQSYINSPNKQSRQIETFTLDYMCA